jgi:hypothetical protein
VREITQAPKAGQRLLHLGQRGDGGESGKPGGQSLRLTAEQWAELHRIAIAAVRHEGGTQETAERVANMLVAVGVLEQVRP